MSPEARAKWEAERLRALTDHMYLGVEVMGMDFQEIPHRGFFSHFIPEGSKSRPPRSMIYRSSSESAWCSAGRSGTLKTSAIIVEIVQFILIFHSIRTCTF